MSELRDSGQQPASGSLADDKTSEKTQLAVELSGAQTSDIGELARGEPDGNQDGLDFDESQYDDEESEDDEDYDSEEDYDDDEYDDDEDDYSLDEDDLEDTAISCERSNCLNGTNLAEEGSGSGRRRASRRARNRRAAESTNEPQERHEESARVGSPPESIRRDSERQGAGQPARRHQGATEPSKSSGSTATHYNTVNDSWFINYNGIIVILPIIFNAFQDKSLERSYQRYSHGQRQKSLIIAHAIDLILKLALINLSLYQYYQSPSFLDQHHSLVSNHRKNSSDNLMLSSFNQSTSAPWNGSTTSTPESLQLLFGPLNLNLNGSDAQSYLSLLLANLKACQLPSAFILANLLIICLCISIPHQFLTNKLSFIALFTWFLLNLQNYLIYNNNHHELSLALEQAHQTPKGDAWLASIVSRASIGC